MEGTFENTGLVVSMHINDWAKFYQPSRRVQANIMAHIRRPSVKLFET